MNCQKCGKELIGKQTKFCSTSCKLKLSNSKFQNYQAQQKRGRANKLKAIEILGSKCSNCGYNKSNSALCFHHEKNKTMNLDLRHFSNNKWETLEKEIKNCKLLCMNCHTELHNPDW
jgi:ribosomal protein L37E